MYIHTNDKLFIDKALSDYLHMHEHPERTGQEYSVGSAATRYSITWHFTSYGDHVGQQI